MQASLRRLLVGAVRRPRILWTSRRLKHEKRTATNRLLSFSQPYKLHVGSGQVYFPGWVNIDADAVAKADVNWDIRYGLLAPDASCQYVYNEHVLEHLAVEAGLTFLRECRRVLAPGGVLRVAMPSLDAIIEKSANGTWRDQDWLTWPEHQFIKTRAEMINISFRWWGHQWLYDREELHRRLWESGFTEIANVEWGVSEEPMLCGRESRKDSLLICEARVRD